MYEALLEKLNIIKKLNILISGNFEEAVRKMSN